MNIQVGERYLITTDGWFVAPDGETYQAAYGTVRHVGTVDDALGFRPRGGGSTNWFIEVGNLIVAGCQVHYAVRTDRCPGGPSTVWQQTASGQVVTGEAPPRIYYADDPPGGDAGE